MSAAAALAIQLYGDECSAVACLKCPACAGAGSANISHLPGLSQGAFPTASKTDTSQQLLRDTFIQEQNSDVGHSAVHHAAAEPSLLSLHAQQAAVQPWEHQQAQTTAYQIEPASRSQWQPDQQHGIAACTSNANSVPPAPSMARSLPARGVHETLSSWSDAPQLPGLLPSSCSTLTSAHASAEFFPDGTQAGLGMQLAERTALQSSQVIPTAKADFIGQSSLYPMYDLHQQIPNPARSESFYCCAPAASDQIGTPQMRLEMPRQMIRRDVHVKAEPAQHHPSMRELPLSMPTGPVPPRDVFSRPDSVFPASRSLRDREPPRSRPAAGILHGLTHHDLWAMPDAPQTPSVASFLSCHRLAVPLRGQPPCTSIHIPAERCSPPPTPHVQQGRPANGFTNVEPQVETQETQLADQCPPACIPVQQDSIQQQQQQQQNWHPHAGAWEYTSDDACILVMATLDLESSVPADDILADLCKSVIKALQVLHSKATRMTTFHCQGSVERPVKTHLRHQPVHDLMRMIMGVCCLSTCAQLAPCNQAGLHCSIMLNFTHDPISNDKPPGGTLG